MQLLHIIHCICICHCSRSPASSVRFQFFFCSLVEITINTKKKSMQRVVFVVSYKQSNLETYNNTAESTTSFRFDDKLSKWAVPSPKYKLDKYLYHCDSINIYATFSLQVAFVVTVIVVSVAGDVFLIYFCGFRSVRSEFKNSIPHSNKDRIKRTFIQWWIYVWNVKITCFKHKITESDPNTFAFYAPYSVQILSFRSAFKIPMWSIQINRSLLLHCFVTFVGSGSINWNSP